MSSAAPQVTIPQPVAIGGQIAGTFEDATGHSAQSHLVYAANARVWWLFTLTSNADSEGGSNHIVKSFHSSGPDLATATWVAAADSPPAVAAAPNQIMGGGRALGVAYLNNSPVDVIHADISMAFDGQDGRTGHIRAVVTGTSIAWSSWNYFDEPAATWTLPRGNTIGVSSGKFIHTAGPILQQEVDANVRKSTNADSGTTWTSGFSVPVVIDGSMVNQNNAFAFAPLANNVMLAVYDNGQNVEPTQTNLRYKRSDANGTWSGIAVGSQTGGDGNVFPTSAIVDQNDWALVPVSTSQIYVFRRKANGTGIDAASYNVATNTWSPLSAAPAAFGPGQSFKPGAGLFGSTDGTSVWVCGINTDLANSILCARFDGAAWTPWSIVPGTEIGIQNRNYISGSPRVGNNQVGLVWTEGTSLFDIVACSFEATPDITAPTVSLTAPASGATVSGTIPISAAATDNVGVAGLQFRVDGVDLGVELTAAPYSLQWNTTTAASGAHVLTAIARDQAGNTATAAAVSVTVANTVTAIVPDVIGQTRTAAAASIVAAGLTLGAVTTASSATVASGSVISQSPSGGTVVPANASVDLVVSSGVAPVSVPNVVGLTQAAASTAIAGAGLKLGALSTAASTAVPSGAVVSQTPAAGTQVTSGTAVALVVSSGPLKVAVPDVVGLSQAAATTAITNAGLILAGVTTAPSSTIAAGLVVSQTPAAATEIASGSAVALVVSSGPPQITVPNVVGLAQAAAVSAVTNAGLKAGVVSAVSSATVAAGLVISQTPAAGVTVASGTAVALLVSSGPAKVAVPNVVGMTQAAATSAITNAGLVVGAVTVMSNAAAPAGSVISQDPSAGIGIPVTSAVALVISSGPGAIGINFVGSAIPMGAAEIAGLIPQANWNNAPGATGTALPLVDDSGASSTASVTWKASGVWMVSTVDQPGDRRLMKGYLDNNNVSVTTVTVGGLSPGDYDVYVYCDGDNKAYNRTATYEISGPGITTTATVVNDAPNANFSGTFSEATGSTGNYVKFRISGSGFTLTATPGTSTNLNVRAPVNGIQIVRAAPVPVPADFTITAVPAAQTVTPGMSTSYTATINGLNAFSGPVALSIAGAPAGTTATFTPSALSGAGRATLDITTSSSTPIGSWPLTIKGTSGQLSRTATVTLVVAQSRIGIKFLGSNPATMAVGDVAGVVAQTHWNNGAGAARSTPLPLVDDSGTPTTATVTWSASGVWMASIVDQPGNPRLMKGYLDNNNLSVTTVTVDGLPPGDYDVYVYCDGDNKAYDRTASYEISGPGIPTSAVVANDAPGANFTGVFREATPTSPAGNYVRFRITGSGFTITATPGTSTNVNVRAPVNGIQIVTAAPLR